MIRLFFIALIYCGLVVPAYSWGPLGHRIVALIAENHLSERARIGVDELLALDGKTRMSQVASWADRNRSTLFFGQQPAHMVRLPLDDSPYDPEKHCEGNRCVVASIEAAVAVLKDPAATAEHRVVSLKYLIHMVGDIHQPVHATASGGSRRVEFEGSVLSIHKLWDTEIIRQQNQTARKLTLRIDSDVSDDVATDIAVSEWAIESRNIARDIIYPDPALFGGKAPVRLDHAYFERHWPAAEVRLKQAGVRLARLLNQIFDENGPSR